MPNRTLFCRSATTFTREGKLDEDAFRRHLERLVEAQIGVYLGAGGNGEGFTFSAAETECVYGIGVEVCKGRVPVGANPPEQYLVDSSLEYARLAGAAGVDIVNVFGPAPSHGYRPTEKEYLHFLGRILDEVDGAVALAPNAHMGVGTRPAVIAELCRRYEQVAAVNLSGIDGDGYFIELQDRLSRPVDLYVPFVGSLNTLELGAAGILNGKGEANFVPRTYQRYLELYASRNFEELSVVYAQLRRVTRFLEAWPGNPRWIKMAMNIFKLPGGDGTVREPYLMADDEEMARFRRGVLALDVPEIRDLARAAGLDDMIERGAGEEGMHEQAN
jgi:4-hydroxy-tetrahydrodipicolinate synthase